MLALTTFSEIIKSPKQRFEVMKLIEETVRLQAAYPFDVPSCALNVMKVMIKEMSFCALTITRVTTKPHYCSMLILLV